MLSWKALPCPRQSLVQSLQCLWHPVIYHQGYEIVSKVECGLQNLVRGHINSLFAQLGPLLINIVILTQANYFLAVDIFEFLFKILCQTFSRLTTPWKNNHRLSKEGLSLSFWKLRSNRIHNFSSHLSWLNEWDWCLGFWESAIWATRRLLITCRCILCALISIFFESVIDSHVHPWLALCHNDLVTCLFLVLNFVVSSKFFKNSLTW